MTSNRQPILRDLGEGLLMRRATRADAKALIEFNAHVFRQGDSVEPNPAAAAYTNDLIGRPHPTFRPGDFTLVVEAGSGKIVSSMNLISQIWTYAGIPFNVGRPELVGTLPEYRNRGLVRAQFEVIHQWSAQRGELLQAITGIPHYYRRFGYEMTMNLGGGRAGFRAHIPKLEEGQTEPYPIRPAVEADIPFIMELYAQGCGRSLVSVVRDENLWRYELSGRSRENPNCNELRLIQTPSGEPIGFFAHPSYAWGAMMAATWYEVKAGVSWAEVTPGVIRYLQSVHPNALSERKKEEFDAFGFWLGEEHPVYKIMLDRLPRVRKPYAWYLRVPDLAGFIRYIAPVLESRLEASSLAGHSGEHRLTFYRDGLRLVFEKGRLTQVENWQPQPDWGSGEAAFPGLTFLQLLFGYRSLEELRYAFVDCWVEGDTTHALLEILFPRQPSDLWPIS